MLLDRRSNLQTMSSEELQSVTRSFKLPWCKTCETHEHWQSIVRHGILEMEQSKLKAQLTMRGIKCEGCTAIEHYVDKLLDSVHVPYGRDR